MACRHEGLKVKDRSEDYTAGHRRAIRACVAWLHRRAEEMVDPKARDILNSAAFNLGCEAAQKRRGCTCVGTLKADCPIHEWPPGFAGQRRQNGSP